MQALVRAHVELGDPMDTAIWIRQDDAAGWLVEVLPEIANDNAPHRPVVFTAGRGFRYPLHLVAVNREDIERALSDSDLATWIASGEILYGEEEGQRLISSATQRIGNGRS